MALDDPLEYKVDIGDFRTFEYTNFYDSRLPNPSKDMRNVRDVNGRFQNFTIKEGTIFKITIIEVSRNYISGIRTIDKVIIEENWIDLFIRPMTNNMSLLRESFNNSDSLKIQSNHIIEQVNESSFHSEGIHYNLNRSRTSIWEKTGWLSYVLIRVYDIETVYYEMEVTKQSSQGEFLHLNEISGLIILSFILIILVYLQLVSKRK